MDFSLVFLVALALTGAANVNAGPIRQNTELHQVFDEFLALIPQEKFVEIVLDYANNDPEVQAVAEYLNSEDFKNLVRKVESIKDVINFYDYLEKAGLDVYVAVNALHEAIGLPPLTPGGLARSARRTGGVAGLIADIKAILPIKDIKALYHEKLQSSAAFAELVSHFQSPRFQQLINALRANPEFQKIVKFAKEHGVDVNAIADLLSTMLGLEFPTSRAAAQSTELHQVFEEFLALIPQEKFVEIIVDYANNDPEVQAAAEYVMSEDFKNLVRKVESIEDVINFYDYLEKAGLDVYLAVNAMHEMIGLPPLVPGGLVRNARRTGGVAGLVADIKAILPIKDIKALYHEKLETSAAFAELVSHFQSPRFQQLINALRTNPEFQKIVKFAKEHGVDVKAIADLLSTMLGLEFPTSRAAAQSTELHQVFEEFLALIPQEKFVEIIVDYANNDPEVQAAAEYVMSEDFKNLVRKVESIEDVINFYDYLEKAGLDVYLAVNAMHEMIGLPPLVPGGHARNARRTGGVAGLVADIKAILPIKDIKALYHEKLETSAAFAELVSHFQSPRFQQLINALRANPEFQKIVKFAKEHGVDVKAIADLLSTMLGLEFPTSRAAARSAELNEVFQEFQALIPKKELLAFALAYANDSEVRAATVYMFSDEFKALLVKAESMKDVIVFFDYLEESGLDVYQAINNIHQVLGLPPINGGFAKNVKVTGGIAGYYADFKALIPTNKVKALREEKLKTSPAYAKLDKNLKSPRFLQLVGNLHTNQEFQRILEASKVGGIDVRASVEILVKMVGLEFPTIPPRTRLPGY